MTDSQEDKLVYSSENPKVRTSLLLYECLRDLPPGFVLSHPKENFWFVQPLGKGTVVGSGDTALAALQNRLARLKK